MTYGILACRLGATYRFARALCPSTLEFVARLRRAGFAVTVLSPV